MISFIFIYTTFEAYRDPKDKPVATIAKSITKGVKDIVAYNDGIYRRRDNANAPDKARQTSKPLLNLD